MVPNAGNREAVTEAVRERLAGFDARLDDASLRTALLAVQGPQAQGIVQPLVDADLATVRYYGITQARVAGGEALVARTGYTGEDGFELFVPWDAAPALWDALMEQGRGAGLVPVGLGARDTLRLEAGMPLYGNELDRTVNPFEAGLGRVVRLDKPGDFVGRAALEAILARPLTRTLVGLVLRERGVARHGYPLYAPAAAAGPHRGHHERQRVADARRLDRHGLRPARCVGSGYHGRGRHPRRPRGRGGGGPALLRSSPLTRSRACGRARRIALHRRPRVAPRGG